MLKRIITSVVAAVCLLLPALIFSHTIAFPLAVGIATVIGLFEMFKCIGVHKRLSLTLPLYLAAIILPLAVRYVDNRLLLTASCFIFAVLYVIYLFVHIIWSHGKLTFSDGALLFTTALYIIAAMNCIIYIRDFGEGGKHGYLLIFIGAWITDIFAYFSGRLFGKHKLIEDVSPKKTVEGSIGGIIFCILSFVAFGIVINAFFNGEANLIFLGVCGFIASVVSQVGDLIMSVIKRHYGIKDYGKLFPGHGGMLDRFDSVLAVSLAIAAVCMLSSIIGISMI